MLFLLYLLLDLLVDLLTQGTTQTHIRSERLSGVGGVAAMVEVTDTETATVGFICIQCELRRPLRIDIIIDNVGQDIRIGDSLEDFRGHAVHRLDVNDVTVHVFSD